MSEKIYGAINKVVYYANDSGFGVVSLKINFNDKKMSQYKDILYSNNLSVTCLFDRKPIVDEKYTFVGEFIENKYGIQLKASSFKRSKPNSRQSVIVYLSSDLFYGIGKVLSSKIYETLGENCLELIKNDKTVLDKVEGITNEQKDILYTGLIENMTREEMVIDLTDMGISIAMTNRIINALNEKSVDIVRKNPYDLIEKVEGIGFIKADKIAREIGIPYDSPLRIKALISYYLNCYTYDTGDSYVFKDDLKNVIMKELNKDNVLISDELYENMINEMIFEGKIIVDNDGNLYDINIYNSENIVSVKICELLNREKDTNISLEKVNNIIEALEDENKIIYNDKQKEAIRNALLENIMIITGGPGTGKSTVIKGIVDGYVKLCGNDLAYEDIVMLAPTGRASKRLSEVTSRGAKTIHRFLGYIGSGRFQHGPDNLVNGKLIIVDEMSMVDIILAARLFSSLKSDVKVILVGDSDQLPSVAPGEVLCNLIETNIVKTIKLDKIHRQAESSTIVSLAHNINNGIIPKNLLERQNDRNFIKMDDDIILDSIITVVKQAMSKNMNLLKDIQVLVPMYKGKLGIEVINNKMQEAFNPLNIYEIKYGNKKFRVNDKVIQLVNRTDKGVMNGDIGYVLSLNIDRDEVLGLTVLYDFGPVDYAKEELEDLNLAYAISIHKSQGSEFKTVIMPLTTNYYIMLKKKLVYTAITRAKEFLIMLGNPEALFICTKHLESRRKTKLVQKIKDQINPSDVSPYDFM